MCSLRRLRATVYGQTEVPALAHPQEESSDRRSLIQKFYRKIQFFPSVQTALERARAFESFAVELHGQSGARGFIRASAVEHDLLVTGDVFRSEIDVLR